MESGQIGKLTPNLISTDQNPLPQPKEYTGSPNTISDWHYYMQ